MACAEAALGAANIERKQVKLMVELDQFKYTLSTFKKPLVEVRDSL